MWVATNRQKAPESAFAKRARLKAEAEAAKAARRTPEPQSVPEPNPDAEALKAAAVPFDRNPESEEYTQAPDIATVEKTGGKPGRKPSSEVEKRLDRILALITQAGTDGVYKAALVQATGESAANVNAALQRLKGEGKVKSEPVEGSKAHRWFAV